jgi:D-alanyl-D-alanine carboxypeptidase/D-alanyl-D-alanine-endopeptidase (penicillin-binding protein 4)
VAPPPVAAQARPTGRFAPDLRRYIDGAEWRRSLWGALVVSVTRGDTLLSLNAERRFTPASNAKLFTTAAALHYLGSDYRFLTVLFADGSVARGTLDGDLVLFGTGDPTFGLDTAQLAPFADSVVLAGIRRIQGDIIGDASFLGAELTGPGWSPDNFDEAYSAPASGLGASENRIRLVVTPGRARGTPATARMVPESDYYQLASTVITGPPGRASRIEVSKGRAGGVLAVSGNIAPGETWSTWVVVDEPAVFAAGLLRRMLERRGVAVTGITRAIADSAGTRARLMLERSRANAGAFAGAIAVRRSAPLAEIVSLINHRSHNLSAELVLRSVGRVRGGEGSFARGAHLVAQYLVSTLGITADNVRVTDGSGLSVLDETTPRALVQLLVRARRGRRPEGPPFYNSIPVLGTGAGRRLSGTAAAGRIRAKTGTLNGVSALAGYIRTADDEELAFSLVVNFAPSVAAARAVQDSIVERLAGFRR